ncbi:MAG: ROK family protein [Planctomycetota bacterium]
MTAAPVIGIDLGGTHMQVGVVDSAGTLLGRSRCHTEAGRGFEAVVGTIAEQCRAACDDASVSLGDIAAAGLAAPGAVDPGRGLVLRAVNLGWDDAPAAEALTRAIGRPVYLDNDVNAAALAEAKLGAGRGHNDQLAVWVGTGIGGGLILGGRVFHGPLFTAGEIGHVIQDIDGAADQRELEHLASRTAISAAIVDGSGLDKPPTSAEMAEAYAAGDEVVRQVIDRAALRIGVAIANVATVLSLGRVVLGGGLVETMGDAFVEPVQRSVREHIFPEELRTIEVVGTQLGSDAGLKGAAMLARQQLEG